MKYGLALIGYGGMAGWHHKSIEQLSDIEVVGAYDIREEMRQKAQENGIKAYESVEALLADPQVDIVTVAVPKISIKTMRSPACVRASMLSAKSRSR